MKLKDSKDFAAKIRQLEAAGCPTMFRSRLSLRIKLTDEPRLRELQHGLAAYVIPVLFCNGPVELEITDVELDLPWDDGFFHLLDEGQDGNYSFPGAPRRMYPREEVLNHFIFDHDVLQPGERRSGMLLAMGFPIPVIYRHNELIKSDLSICDQFGGFHPMPLSLRLDRSGGAKVQPANARMGKGPFEGNGSKDVGTPFRQAPCRRHN